MRENQLSEISLPCNFYGNSDFFSPYHIQKSETLKKECFIVFLDPITTRGGEQIKIEQKC